MINLLCALAAEARPVIDHLRLKAEPPRGGYRFYAAADYRLAVSDMGVVNAAAATALLSTASPGPAAWVNIGIAGHGSLALGEAALAAKVSDATTGQSWYPQCPFSTALPRLPLLSLPQPEDPACHLGWLIDMEAAGFFAVATRFASLELVQSLKVVSDNRGEPSPPAAHQVTALIARRITALDALLDRLRQLLDDVTPAVAHHPGYDAFTAHHRYSVSQQHELRRLLGRWCALGGDGAPGPAPGARSAGQALAKLRAAVEALGRARPLGSVQRDAVER